MRFYISCTHISSVKKNLFGNARYELNLVSIAICSSNGSNYYAVSSDFPKKELSELERLQLPRETIWKRIAIIADEVQHFIATQAAGDIIEFWGWQPASDFVSFASLWGGMKSLSYPFPKTKMYDVSQTFYEFADMLPEDYFKLDYPLSIEQKMELLMELPGCPRVREESTSINECVWIRGFDAFLESTKQAYFLPEI